MKADCEMEYNLPGNLGSEITDIRGGLDYATITYDNGYVIKVYGQLMPGANFIAYKSSIKKWEAPYDMELLTTEMKEKLIADVESKNSPEKVNIIFE